MDTLRLEMGKREDPSDGLVDAVDIFVNGHDLQGIVKERELPFAAREGRPHLAGSHAGLPPGEMLLPSRRLLGRPETHHDAQSPDGKLAVLGCVCGEPGCWPLQARITVREDVVVWGEFEQPHRRL